MARCPAPVPWSSVSWPAIARAAALWSAAALRPTTPVRSAAPLRPAAVRPAAVPGAAPAERPAARSTVTWATAKRATITWAAAARAAAGWAAGLWPAAVRPAQQAAVAERPRFPRPAQGTAAAPGCARASPPPVDRVDAPWRRRSRSRPLRSRRGGPGGTKEVHGERDAADHRLGVRQALADPPSGIDLSRVGPLHRAGSAG